MFWKVGDHLARIIENEENEESGGFEDIWMAILKKLIEITIDEHPELRHSAIHTLTNLIVYHG